MPDKTQSTTLQTPDADLGIEPFDGEPTDDTEILPLQNGSFPVVGIGGSAGAIPALQTFFREMPDNPGMAFVVILHLSPDYESHLATILGNVTKMPVVQVTETITIEKDHVYVIPPTHLLTMHDGKIELAHLQRETGRRVAVDLFFRALAESQEARAICIVLSGTDSDGSIGLKRVKERGGLTLAQDPSQAQYDEMPRNAIETGMVDWVLPVEKMPARLMELLRKEPAIRLPSVHPPLGAHLPDSETALRQILELLDANTGHNFIHYKRATVLRRIARRLQVNGLTGLPTYLDFLRTNSAESVALLQDLLISVTNFFRDKTAFEALELLLPTLLRDKKEDGQIRVWVPGCATGEEAYSLAMILAEYVDSHDPSLKVQVFATDIDTGAIAFAREGLYPTSIVADVSPERLRRFFVPEQGRYRIRKDLRETVLFAAHNLLRDSPFSSLDLISCRNLLIYFGAQAQESVLDTFHFALRPNSILMLGSSESVGESPLFGPLDKKNRIFRRNETPRPSMPLSQLPMQPRRLNGPLYPAALPTSNALGITNGNGAVAVGTQDYSSFSELHLQLLEEYAPPSVLVNEDYDIMHLSQGAGQFLQWGGGDVSINLLKVVPDSMRLELQTALFQALQSGNRVELSNVSAQLEGESKAINVVVRPLHHENAGQNFLLVIFDLQARPPQAVPVADEPVARRLQTELQHVKTQLKSTSKQFETSTEELKASNEELQAMNEELRSATEELETGKEELQSVNEELITVNAELKHKVEEVSSVNSNLNNLMSSTDIATIFLDRRGCIRRYTPRAVGLFNLIPTDIGRPLADLRHKFNYAAWAKDAEKTLGNLEVIEHEVRSEDGGWFLSRMLPYRTIEDRIDGVVLTFVDITARKNAEEASRASEERFRLLVAGVRDYAIFLFDEAGTITSWNNGVERVFGYHEKEWIGRNWEIIFPREDQPLCVELMQRAREGRAASIERWEVRKDGTKFWASDAIDVDALFDANGELRGYVKIVRDMSERRDAEDKLRAANEELEERVAARTAELEEINEALSAENLERRQAEDGGLILVRQLEDELGRIKQLLQGIPAGVIIAYKDGRPIFVNTRAQLTLSMPDGVDHDSLVRDWLYAPNSPLERALKGENTANEEIEFARDGNELSLSVSAEPIPDVLTRGDAQISAAIVAFQDVTDRKRAEIARQQLLQRVVSAQEEERTRISRELHDQMGQSLTALLMVINSMTQAEDGDSSSQTRLGKLKVLVEELMDQAHLLAWELRPPALDNLGLRAALEQYLKEWSRSTGIRAEFASRGLTNLEHLDKTVETTLYRVVQEALSNVHRHSGSEVVSVLLERMDGEITVIIEDNGKGFDVEAVTSGNSERLGLIGMRERIELVGGNLTIESTPEQGTTVYARVAGERRRAEQSAANES